MMTEPETMVRVRAKIGSKLALGRDPNGKMIMALPGQFVELPVRELQNQAIAAQVETEEQAAASDAVSAVADEQAATQGAPRVDPEFMRRRRAFRAQTDAAVENLAEAENKHAGEVKQMAEEISVKSERADAKSRASDAKPKHGK